MKQKKGKRNVPQAEIVEEDIEKPKKKQKKSKKAELQLVTTDGEVENISKKKKKSEVENENKETTKKENKNKKRKQETVDMEESSTEPEIEVTKKDKQKKDKEETRISEESDEIDTDIYEDSDQVLSPQELGLIDFTDCTTAKQYKKRIVSLLKSIKNRTRRVDKIDRKLSKIEKKGLTMENKKFHTAMHNEKNILKERIQKLFEALTIAQGKLKEFDDVEKVEYKKKKKEGNLKGENETESTKVEKKDTESKALFKKVDIKVVENLKPALEAASIKDFWALSESTAKNVPEEDSSSSEDEVCSCIVFYNNDVLLTDFTHWGQSQETWGKVIL